mgnify:CR=1 FL=1
MLYDERLAVSFDTVYELSRFTMADTTLSSAALSPADAITCVISVSVTVDVPNTNVARLLSFESVTSYTSSSDAASVCTSVFLLFFSLISISLVLLLSVMVTSSVDVPLFFLLSFFVSSTASVASSFGVSVLSRSVVSSLTADLITS